MSNDFKPWRTDFTFASIHFAIAATALFLATKVQTIAGLRTYCWTTATVFICATIFYFRRGTTRAYGTAVERQALKQLARLLMPGWALQANVMVKNGDLDGLLEGPEGRGYALEIKSQSSIRLAKGGFFTKDRLLDHKGKSTGEGSISQTRRNAEHVGAVPVLWYPRAKHRGCVTVGDVVIVAGSAKDLLKRLGVPRRGWF